MFERLINLSKLPIPQSLTTMESILTNLENHPDTPKDIPPPYPNLVTLRANFNIYKNHAHKAENFDRLEAKLRDQARKQVETDFQNFGHFLITSGKDAFFLLGVGFIVEQQPPQKNHAANASETKPGDPQVSHATVSTKVWVKCKPHRGAKMLEVQFTEDPSSEASWVQAGLYTKASKMEVSGLQPGKKYYFRVRYLGGNGAGPWSEIVSLICI
jgi:hypothetical protein